MFWRNATAASGAPGRCSGMTCAEAPVACCLQQRAVSVELGPWTDKTSLMRLNRQRYPLPMLVKALCRLCALLLIVVYAAASITAAASPLAACTTLDLNNHPHAGHAHGLRI